MSLRARMILAIGALIFLALAALSATVLIDAGPRLKAEDENMVHLAESIVSSSLVSVENDQDPRASLAALVARLQTLRHVTIRLASRPVDDRERTDKPPTWISRVLGISAGPRSEIPVHIGGRVQDTIIITPKPGDELAEISDTIVRIIEYGLMIGLGIWVLTTIVINRSLKPISALSVAMEKVEHGDFAVRVPVEGPPEILRMCARMNALAAALHASRQESRRLAARMVEIQDIERREIARDLHDELGPYLFTLRATGQRIERELARPGAQPASIAPTVQQLAAHIDAIQATNRRVLQRLCPMALDELGLSGALRATAAMWRKERPDVDLQVHLSEEIDDLHASAALTVYRVVQEGLTNAFRHSRARRIVVDVQQGAEPPDGIEISVTDDGVGLASNIEWGYGLTNMRERLAALGGGLSLTRGASGGTVVSARLPVQQT